MPPRLPIARATALASAPIAGSATRKTRRPSRRTGAAAQRLALAHARDRTGREPADAADRGEGRRPADAVGGGAGVALELAERGLGLAAEDAVLAPGVEAERVQPALELGDVVAAQHRPDR